MSTTAEVLCTVCAEPALAKSKTPAARREVAISGICGVCWDAIFNEGHEDEDSPVEQERRD